MRGYWFFKLFNSIKEEHEVDFAELELRSIFGSVERVRNFSDLLTVTPLRHFVGDENRIQDLLTYEPCYGHFQGFFAVRNDLPDIEKLVRRLAYTREIYALLQGVDPQTFIQEHLSSVQQNRKIACYKREGFTLFRFVTNQYYLEKSYYISKLTSGLARVDKNEDDIRRNVITLVEYPFKEVYRIPASATMAVGKRLQDYLAIREELSMYLTHELHPYKGKFHAKMVRALLNYVMSNDDGLAMDNFAGSGTLLLEASLMGVQSIGVEINPLSVLMSNAKCQASNLKPSELNNASQIFLQEVKAALAEYATISSGGTLLVQPHFDARKIDSRRQSIPKNVLAEFKRGVMEELIIAQQVLEQMDVGAKVHEFLLLALSGAISDMVHRTSAHFLDVLEARLYWMYLRIFLFHELNKHLGIPIGESQTYIGDTRDLLTCRRLDGSSVKLADNSADAIVNSPPYSTALDYIRNDLPQLTILGLVESLDHLERDMMGNPNLRYYPDALLKEIEANGKEFGRLPEHAKQIIEKLIQAGRKKEGLRTYKFFKDMYLALAEMHRVLKRGGKAAIIIGNNHYKLDGEYIEVKNDEVIAEMGEALGFVRDASLPIPKPPWLPEDKIPQIKGGIRRELEKTMSGMIRYETVLILEKLA